MWTPKVRFQSKDFIHVKIPTSIWRVTKAVKDQTKYDGYTEDGKNYSKSQPPNCDLQFVVFILTTNIRLCDKSI